MKVYTSPNFHLKSKQKINKVLLTQKILNPIIHTHGLPETHAFLAQNLPTIFANRCYNVKNLPFSEEVKSTEVGHLLEHLILEFLKIESEKDYLCVSFKGETQWNWSKYGYGLFRITISSNINYQKYFDKALSNAAQTLDNLYFAHSLKN